MKPYHYEKTLMVCLAIAVCQVLGDTGKCISDSVTSSREEILLPVYR